MKLVAIAVGLIAVTCAAASQGIDTVEAYASGDAAPIAARELVGDGRWVQESGVKRTETWEVDVSRADDGTINGKVRIQGSPFVTDGVMTGRIIGRQVTGAITDEAGLHVATFSGALGKSGEFRGTYEDRAGGIGSWVWSGPPPQ